MVRVCGSRVWRGRLGVLTEGVSVFRIFGSCTTGRRTTPTKATRSRSA